MVEPDLRPFSSVARAPVGLYDVYLPVVFNRQWMRLYVFSGLSDIRINKRYFRIIEQRFSRPLCVEVRAEFDMIGPDARPITNDELDYIRSFHGCIFYHGIRRMFIREQGLWSQRIGKGSATSSGGCIRRNSASGGGFLS
jgi:hypothetical protein